MTAYQTFLTFRFLLDEGFQLDHKSERPPVPRHGAGPTSEGPESKRFKDPFHMKRL